MKESEWKERYGPWALVTGATDGMGRALATSLARRGLNVVLVARRETALAALASELRGEGIECRIVAADLGTREGVEKTLQALEALDVGLLVAAAGFGTSGPFVESSLEDELAEVGVSSRRVGSRRRARGLRGLRGGQGAPNRRRGTSRLRRPSTRCARAGNQSLKDRR